LTSQGISTPAACLALPVIRSLGIAARSASTCRLGWAAGDAWSPGCAWLTPHVKTPPSPISILARTSFLRTSNPRLQSLPLLTPVTGTAFSHGDHCHAPGDAWSSGRRLAERHRCRACVAGGQEAGETNLQARLKEIGDAGVQQAYSMCLR